MSTQLHQLTVKYLPAEDRILLRIGTSAKTEYRLWLTRRFIAALWPSLGGQLAETADVQALRRPAAVPQDGPVGKSAAPEPPQTKPPVTPEVREALLGMEHQTAIDQSDFSKTHEEDNVDLTANTGPMMVTGAKVKPWDGKRLVMGLQTQNGSNITVTLDKKLLHGFCHMISTTVHKAGWGLNLAIGDPAQAAAPTRAIH
ncbi:MAG: hypothetical protein VW268_14665 [Rhodospirillaceae bacterium]